jgi:ribosomal protein L11 methyltransferase
MAAYVEVVLGTEDKRTQEMLVAILSQLSYEGFEESAEELKAYIPENLFDEKKLTEVLSPFGALSISKNRIEEENWNQLWEKDFHPVIIDDFAAIRADFHHPISNVEHEIIITPKMSFGTGHHSTTVLMIQQMRELDFRERTVADFGTGTGILSILAEKCGAEKITAIDYDDWSITNARENISANHCSKIDLVQAESFASGQQYDFILANINRNVILDNFSQMVSGLASGGKLLISGILITDLEVMKTEAGKFSLVAGKITQDNNWVSILFTS